ncbi:alcohol dehydrogenase catalytic domain-containing protein [Streptosporangium sp. NPDC002607]
MKALIYHGPEDVRYETVADPAPRDRNGAVVRVTHAGICGSDLHVYHGHNVKEPNFCIGHEAIGEVVETGGEVGRWRTGDKVLIAAGVRCGRCDWCSTGYPACQVQKAWVYGLGPELPGSQAEAVAVPFADTNLVRIPEGVSDENALLLADCANTAWYGAKKARIAPGATVAVIGLGPIGQVAVLAAKLQGASRVLAVDPVAERRAQAEALGAEAFTPEAAAEEILTRAPRGVPSVVDAAGTDQTIDLALRVVGLRGAVSVIGLSQSHRYAYPMQRAQMLSIDFHIGLATGEDTMGLFDLMAAGRFDPSVVISHRLPLSAGPAAYEMFAGRRDGVTKIVFNPAGSVA